VDTKEGEEFVTTKPIIMEWECRCFLENAKDGDVVKTWLSELGQPADYKAGKLAQPKDPCPDCGQKDRIRRMSSLRERWSL
jgi:hypothetical protein